MRTRSAIVAILVATVWGLCFVLIKASLPSPAPLLLAGVRALIGGAGLAGWVLLRARRPAGSGSLTQVWRFRRWLDGLPRLSLLVALALTNGTLALGSMYLAAEHAEAGAASILSGGQPLVLAVAGWAIFGERLSSRTVVGLALAMAGVILVAMTSSGATSAEGIALALVATVAPAIGTILMRRLGPHADLPMITGAQFLIGGAILLGVSAPTERWADLAWPPSAVISLLILGVLGTGVAYVAWFWLLGQMSLVNLSAALFLVPAVGVVASIATGERPAPLELAGMATLFIGIATVSRGGVSPPRHRVSETERT
jgi:drug/metabolite transporter (DMT)-like permease